MKTSLFWVILLVVGSTSIVSSRNFYSYFTDQVLAQHAVRMPNRAAECRKLKEEGYSHGTHAGSTGSYMGTEDYSSIDPVPDLKNSVRSGPIEHGTPVIPYLPSPSVPSPPGHSK